MENAFMSSSRSYMMSRIRGTDTKPEIVLRKALHARGLRYRKNVRSLPGTPDVVLARFRTAIFVNGCFWHGHEGCAHYTHPKTNSEFWEAKVARNRQRDALCASRLEALGWAVITVWECELDRKHIDGTVDAIMEQLALNLESWRAYAERRRTDREFAREEARKRREVRAAIEAELRDEYHIPMKIIKMSHEEV